MLISENAYLTQLFPCVACAHAFIVTFCCIRCVFVDVRQVLTPDVVSFRCLLPRHVLCTSASLPCFQRRYALFLLFLRLHVGRTMITLHSHSSLLYLCFNFSPFIPFFYALLSFRLLVSPMKYLVIDIN